MVWFYKGTRENERRMYNTLRTWDFCRRYLLYHKATIRDLYKMDLQNVRQLTFGTSNDETVREVRVNVNCTEYHMKFNDSLI